MQPSLAGGIFADAIGCTGAAVAVAVSGSLAAVAAPAFLAARLLALVL